MTEITMAWLNEQGACSEGKTWFASMYGATAVDVGVVLAHLRARCALHPYWGYGWPCWVMAHVDRVAYAHTFPHKRCQPLTAPDWAAGATWCVGVGPWSEDEGGEAALMRLDNMIADFHGYRVATPEQQRTCSVCRF